jgi:hypothetical protein
MIKIENRKCEILKESLQIKLPKTLEGYLSQRLDKIAPGPQLVKNIIKKKKSLQLNFFFFSF